MSCKRQDCFYRARGTCISMSVLSADNCDHFLHKKLSRRRYKPNREQMSRLRQHLEQHAPQPHPRVTQTRAIHERVA